MPKALMRAMARGPMKGRMEEFGFLLTRLVAGTKPSRAAWPYVPGSYVVSDPWAPVAVTTLGSVDLAAEVAGSPPPGLCITGKVETENIGIEKILKNILSNPSIRFLVCAGNEPPKHLTGATLLALFRNGIDGKNHIPEAPGMRPLLPNTSFEEVEAFRAQVTPVDMIGCTDVGAIHARVAELAAARRGTQSRRDFRPPTGRNRQAEVEHVTAEGTDPARIKLDKAGYFVIHLVDGGLLVEHYDYKENLLRVVEGRDARSIYLTLIENGWVSKLDHAAYLGKELARAQASLERNKDFTQDGA